MIYDSVATHSKLTISGTTENFTTVTGFNTNIQPANGESTAFINGAYGKTFTAFTTYSGLNIGDKFTVGSTNYLVRAVRAFPTGFLPHYEITAVLPEV